MSHGSLRALPEPVLTVRHVCPEQQAEYEASALPPAPATSV